jgi:cytochrome oxidase assembly protein ShyY1
MSRKYWFSGLFVFGSLITGRACLWQLQRKKWKEDLIQARTQYIEQPAETLEFPLSKKDWNYRPVKLTGRFDHSKEMLMMRTNGLTTGYKILTPFLINEKCGLIVNRGWVPTTFKDQKSRKENSEVLEISGVLKPGDIPGSSTPENLPSLGEWHYVDLPHMAHLCGLSNSEAKEWMLQEINWQRNRELYEGEDLPELPVKAVKSELLAFTIMPYTHATYATFWFLSSMICAFYALVSLRR